MCFLRLDDRDSVVSTIDAQCLREVCGSPRKISIGLGCDPAATCEFRAVYHFARPKEDAAGPSFWPAHDVRGPVHAVAEVDVQVTGRTKHCGVPIGLAPVGMRSGILLTTVCLDLDDADRHIGGDGGTQ